MSRKRSVLEQLKRAELLATLDAYGLDVADRRVRALLIDVLVRARRVTLDDVLVEFSRDRLKELCRALDLDDSGRAKAVLVERLTGGTAKAPPREAKEPAPTETRPRKASAIPDPVIPSSPTKKTPEAEQPPEEEPREEPRTPETTPEMPPIDLERLLKLRLVVGRYGEMDMAGWWNTKHMLGSHGRIVLERGFRRTHLFVQARVVFAVAKSRCAELFQPPGCMTLWHLPPEIEDQFEERWHTWLDEIDRWTPFFDDVMELQGDLLENLKRLDLVSETQIEAVGKLRRSAEGRAVPLPGTYRPDDDVLTLLAAGFARGESGKPAIPYARLDG